VENEDSLTVRRQTRRGEMEDKVVKVVATLKEGKSKTMQSAEWDLQDGLIFH